jgi:hypothetical protein
MPPEPRKSGGVLGQETLWVELSLPDAAPHPLHRYLSLEDTKEKILHFGFLIFCVYGCCCFGFFWWGGRGGRVG